MPDTRLPVRRALLSVSDKSGLLPLARGLIAHGAQLLSTGGTAKALREAGLPVRVADEEYLWLFESLYNEIAFRVLDQSGKVVIASTAAPEFWLAADKSNRFFKPGTFEFEQNGIMMDAANGVRVHDGKTWFFQVAVSRRFMFFAHDTFALRFIEDGLILLSLVLFFVFGACVHFALGYTLRPLLEC